MARVCSFVSATVIETMPRLVLGVQARRRRGHDQAGRPFALDQAGAHAVLGLLDRLVADAALRSEQTAHQVGGHVAGHAGRLVQTSMRWVSGSSE